MIGSGVAVQGSSSVAFRESVRKNARYCFEKKGFAGNRHFQGTANFRYLDAIKCHIEARNIKFGQTPLRNNRNTTRNNLDSRISKNLNMDRPPVTPFW